MEAKYVDGKAGLILRENSPDVAGAGYECAMEDHKDGDFNTGAVAVMLTKNAMGRFAVPSKVSTKSDRWFTLEVLAHGNRIQTSIDGAKAVEFIDINNEFKEGFIGLAVHGPGAALCVKTLQIKELPPEERGWIQLFNGEDVDGWTPAPFYKWKVENGALLGVAPSTLTSNRGYGDFHCRIKAKFNANGVGSFTFGGRAGDDSEVRIGDHPKETATGSLLSSSKSKTETIVAWNTNPIPPETWFDLEVILRGKNVTTKVNGTTTAEQQLDTLASGFPPIGIRAMTPGTVLTIGKIEIREPAEAVGK